MIQGKLRLTTLQGTGRQFVAESGTGHAFVMDDGDGKTGPKPIEFALLALGGCTAFDVINILRKKRQVVTGYEIELSAEQRGASQLLHARRDQAQAARPNRSGSGEGRHSSFRDEILLCGCNDLEDRQNRDHIRDLAGNQYST